MIIFTLVQLYLLKYVLFGISKDMGAAAVIVIVVLALLFLWAIGSFKLTTQSERFNNMQPVDFHASMLNKYQDYVFDNIGMKNRDYQLEGLLHT